MDLKDLFGVAVTFVALGVLISFGLNVQTDIRDDFVTNTAGCNSTVTSGCGYEYNASKAAIESNTNVASKLPILGTIIIAAIVVGVLIKAFSM